MNNIKDIVNRLFLDMTQKQMSNYGGIEQEWGKLIMEKEQAHVKLEGVNDGVISIIVDSPAWLFHFKTRRTNLLKQIKMISPEVKSLHFRIGKI